MPDLAAPDGLLGSHPQPVPTFNGPQRGHRGHGKRQRKHPPSHQAGPSGALSEATQGTCYNCGSSDHFVQNCPERRQDGHPGSHRNPHPPKRQRTAGSMESHLRGNSSHKHKPRPQRGFTHPPPPDYRQYEPPGHYPPQPRDPWHHPPPQPYGYAPYGPHEPPYHSNAYGPQYPPPRDAHGPIQQDYYPPPYPRHHGERDYPPYHSEHRPPAPRDVQRRQARDYWSRYDNVRSVAPVVEPWMDELDPIEIPDTRHDPNQIVWRPPQAVARPLPSTLTDRDELTMPPPMASLPRDMSVSKYILDKKAEEFDCNIRDTEDWPFMMDDPIFLEIPMDSELISVKELLAIRAKVYETHRVERQPTPAPNDEEDAENEEIRYEDPDQASDGDQNQEVSYTSDSESYDNQSRSDGSHREFRDEPSSPISGEIIEQDLSEQPLDQADDSHSPLIQKQRDYRLNSQPGWRGRQQQQFVPPPPPPNGDSIQARRGSTEHANEVVNGYSSDNHRENGREEHGHRQEPEATSGSIHQDHLDSRGYAASHRHRHKRNRPDDVSDSGAEEPRRQIDDVTPRMKRRQPQVAEAYRYILVAQ
ncbi:predicted protein [Uncinocarpus reesii 1704]|uniref:CCHC-type domain-containing protein n=1 Tax=Uncinocarpus reesii (strain UAMH 1704) TaxID=336963 RepID=C4JRU9_UNCRE|nr:uncharacterized protein UREG_05188 [Uncinocarpus reesii 1704]EEP80346.1 predicted protein [Uncinocarpus reesii 1704]